MTTKVEMKQDGGRVTLVLHPDRVFIQVRLSLGNGMLGPDAHGCGKVSILSRGMNSTDREA
jgi:hypothetical protein